MAIETIPIKSIRKGNRVYRIKWGDALKERDERKRSAQRYSQIMRYYFQYPQRVKGKGNLDYFSNVVNKLFPE